MVRFATSLQPAPALFASSWSFTMTHLRAQLRTRTLQLETLESRALLATTATALGGILRIVGDNNANDVRITAGAVPGRVIVNGVTGAPKIFNNITGITADLKSGNDFFKVGTSDEPLELLGNITANLGNGSDTFNIRVNSLGAIVVNGGLQAGSGAQDDFIDVSNSILGSLIVNTYAGNDTLNISDSAILSLVANLGVQSLTSGQTDSDGAFFASSAIGTAAITLGGAANGGGNIVDVGSTIFGSLAITGGAKSDSIYIGSTEECGIGGQLRDGLVDLIDDLEPLLESAAGSPQILTLLNGIDGLLSQVSGALDIDLEGFDLSELYLSNNGDLSDTVDQIFGALEEEGLDFCAIGAQTTIFSALSIITLGGADFIGVGSGLLAVETLEIPSPQQLVGAAQSADVLILGVAVIDTGAQNDGVELLNVFVGSTLSVSLGAGNDDLCVVDVTAAVAVFNGGAGIDALLFDFDGVRDSETGYLAYSAILFDVFGACFVGD
jgi:hypothetical protein